ncbi:MAG: hypothetical protein KDE25_00925, partial [Novosphingobium sp.]|nr:hypothetical protein [Novosphingobium sp.]
AEWLRRGLQILARRFDSGSGLQHLDRKAAATRRYCPGLRRWLHRSIRKAIPIPEIGRQKIPRVPPFQSPPHLE